MEILTRTEKLLLEIRKSVQAVKDSGFEGEVSRDGVRFKSDGIASILLIVAATIIIIQNHGKIPGVGWVKKKLRSILK
jgi:hypothetical protein